MININNETFIYNYPFLVIDESRIVKLNVKLNKGTNDRLPKTFLIKFNENIPSNIDSNKQTLFNTFKIDNNFLKKISTKEVYSDNFEIMKVKQEAVYFENMCIFKTCTVAMLRYIIAYQLELNISNVLVVSTGIYSKNDTMCCNNEISLSKLNIPHYEIMKNAIETLMTYDSCISIGNERFIVYIVNNNDNKLNNYEETFYKDYYQTAIYVKKILSNLDKQKINKYRFNINISQIVVTLGYEGREGSHSSINISKPGITKGQHWHNSKWELFIVVSGHGLIQERNINTGEKVEFEVSGDKIEAVYMIPGWTHNIINLSDSENMVTVMTSNEIFNPEHPDTFFEPV